MSQAQVVGFRPQTARRILKQLNIEGTEQLPSGYPFPDDGARTAILYTHSTAIPARSGTTAGSGVAKLYRIGASDILETVKDSTNADIVVTVKNISASEVGAGKYIQAKREYYSGFWIVDFEDC